MVLQDTAPQVGKLTNSRLSAVPAQDCMLLLPALTTPQASFWGAHQVSRMVTVLSGSMSEPGTHASGQCMRYMSRYSQPRSLMDCWQDALKRGKEYQPFDMSAMALQASGMRVGNVKSCSVQGTRLCTDCWGEAWV